MSIDSEELKIESEELKIRDQDDKKCAPGRTFTDGSCFTFNELKDIAEAYNKKKSDKIDLSKINYKKKYEKYKNKNDSKDMGKRFLVKELTEKMADKCKNQKCWIEQPFMESISNEKKEKLENNVFRPEGPSKGRKWLNTENIDKVMTQYEKKYEDFKYLGTMPRDFQDHNFLKQTPEFYEKLIKSGKTRFGMVYNTDKLGESGQHWNAMFADIKNGLVLFFDSYGVEPCDEVKNHMELIKNIFQKNCSSVVKIMQNDKNLMTNGGEIKCNLVRPKINKKRHQYKGSECGVYSMNFILRMLRGDTFDDICNDKVPDDTINKCRKVYFRDE